MTSSIKDKLEIILVTYNRCKHLKSTLKQLFDAKSPVKDLDITILDNKSTDGTFELVEEYCKKYPNLKHIVHNRNIGGNANIARAYEMAKKEYIWVLCDDDKYNWKNWKKIEDSIISDDYYALMVVSHKEKNNLADIFYEATFAPAIIYRTSIITDSVIENMMCNIPNLFPQLALISKVINDRLNIYRFVSHKIIIRGVRNDREGINTYLRAIDDSDLLPSRKNMFWFVGYINSLQLINDKKNRDFILNNSYHCCSNMFELLTHKLCMNMYFYKNNHKNLRDIFYGLNQKWRILFFICYFRALFRHIFIKPFLIDMNIEDWQKYIKKYNTIKRMDKITKKYKNVLLYGAGIVAEAIKLEGGDFSKFKYVSDAKFSEGDTYYGVPALPPSQIRNHQGEIDAILVSVYRFKMIEKILREMGIKTKLIKLL